MCPPCAADGAFRAGHQLSAAGGAKIRGIGIAAEHLPKLTERFYQVDGSLSRTHEGAGLGLYLVRKFMALHGGTVAIASEQGKGTEVTLRFPAARVLAAREPTAA